MENSMEQVKISEVSIVFGKLYVEGAGYFDPKVIQNIRTADRQEAKEYQCFLYPRVIVDIYPRNCFVIDCNTQKERDDIARLIARLVHEEVSKLDV